MRIIQDSDDESEDDIEIIVPALEENDASGSTAAPLARTAQASIANMPQLLRQPS